MQQYLYTWLFYTEVTVGFTKQSFAVQEGDGNIEVCLVLEGYTTKPFTVQISTRDGTAKGTKSQTFYLSQ